jgi:hypothetical protein
MTVAIIKQHYASHSKFTCRMCELSAIEKLNLSLSTNSVKFGNNIHLIEVNSFMKIVPYNIL